MLSDCRDMKQTAEIICIKQEKASKSENVENNTPDLNKRVKYEDYNESKQYLRCTEEFSSQAQVLRNMNIKMSGREIVAQLIISEEDEEVHCYAQNHLPFFKQEHRQSSEKMIHGEKYLEIGKHDELLCVLPEYESSIMNEKLNRTMSTNVVEMTRDNEMKSRITETEASLESAGCHERTVDTCDTQTDCKLTLQNEDCRQESDNIFSLHEKNYDLNTSNMGYRSHSGVPIPNVKREKIKLFRGNVYKCDDCGAGFIRYSSLGTHMRKHTGEMPYECSVCGVKFSYCSSLEIHTKTHTGEKPYKCNLCDVSFTAYHSLERHIRTHTREKPYKCDYCGIGFTEYYNLETHKRTHTGEKPYKCDVCSAGFAHCSALKLHKRKHTGEKPYKCDICNTEFTNCSNLETHKRTHTGEKPYKCDVCGAEFTQCGTLTTHKRTHTGEKPYKCNMCGVGFAQHSTLTTHKRTHTGEKPYKCDICDVRFAQRCHIERHIKMHTG